jgi:hypothetical protein
MSTRNLPWGKGQSACKADNLTAICEPTVLKMWESQCFTTLWACTAYYRNSFTFLPLQYWSLLGSCKFWEKLSINKQPTRKVDMDSVSRSYTLWKVKINIRLCLNQVCCFGKPGSLCGHQYRLRKYTKNMKIQAEGSPDYRNWGSIMLSTKIFKPFCFQITY